MEKVVGPNNVPTKPILLKVSPVDMSTPLKSPSTPSKSIIEDPINRHIWDDEETGRLLEVIKTWWKPLRNARNKRLIWAKIAEQVSPALNADKVIDKWKMLKRKFRKMYPEPFPFSDTLRELLGDVDVSDLPGSDFLSVDGDGVLNNSQQQDADASLMDVILEQPASKKRKLASGGKLLNDTQYELFYDMKKMLEERDEKMMKMFKEFHQDNTKLLQQLIAKMPSGYN